MWERMRRRILSVLLLSLLLLTGCGAEITEGEVIQKEFTPAHTKLRMIPVVYSNGKTTHTAIIPYVYSYSDKWTITIRAYSEDGEEIRETFRVSEQVYDETELGSEFIYTDDMEPDEPEYTREKES